MILFRRALKDDLKDIHHLSDQSGVIGITTLPNDIDLLKKRLDWSISSFEREVKSPGHEYYLFVLEDSASGKVVGTSAVEARVGAHSPFYSYKVSKLTQMCHALHIRTDHEVLSLVNDYQGVSEICTLYLDPTYRKHSFGLLLSRARFLFIANYPKRFAKTIIAEMRGHANDEGRSPFWDQIGAHFFKMSFTEADKLTLSTDKQFIADLMPKNPIYVNLLEASAQAVIGTPHPSTMPAMKILLHEGFHYNNYVDIFDAGPTIEAPRDLIRTAALSKVFSFKNSQSDVSSKRFIIATTTLDFRATVSQVVFNQQESSCSLNHETAALLQVKAGDKLRISPL